MRMVVVSVPVLGQDHLVLLGLVNVPLDVVNVSDQLQPIV